MGAFADWQWRYAEIGIPTFPVRAKTPAVKGYLKLGLATSRELVTRFGHFDSFGLSLQTAGIVVVDVDSPDERVLEDALTRHGESPFVVRSGSGHFQAWYRRQNETRCIRPDPSFPIDILGRGFVVAPPSLGKLGTYEIVRGDLTALACLPSLRNGPRARAVIHGPTAEGRRNDRLFDICLQEGRACDDIGALLDVARTVNEGFLPPMGDEEVVRVARSAWGYTERGENWKGVGRRIVATLDEVDGLMSENPDAFLLLMMLRRHHGPGDRFIVANAMSKTMPGGGWTVKRFAAARRHLIDAGLIVELRPARKGSGPALYRF